MTRSKIIFLLVGLYSFSLSTSAQNNSNGLPAAIQSYIENLKLKVDTTTPPGDSLTSKVRILRAERSILNFDTVIKYSIVSQQSNDTKRPKEFYQDLLEECQHGYTHHLIENVLINLYRQCFTEKEMDQLVEFYKTPVGKRMLMDIMLITATAGPAIQQIVKETSAKIDQQMNAGEKKK